jgi:hypothetical protein
MPKFGWKAVYEDGVIKQYPAGKPEVLYNDVKARGLPLKFFVGRQYGVNLKTGELLIKGKWMRVGNIDGEPFKPSALIYFRRHQVSVTPGVCSTHDVWHFIGYLHSAGMVRLCIPDGGPDYTVCVGSGSMGQEHIVTNGGVKCN